MLAERCSKEHLGDMNSNSFPRIGQIVEVAHPTISLYIAKPAAGVHREQGGVGETEPLRERWTYTSAEVCSALQISKVTLWRLEKRGLLTPIPHLRHKRYFVGSVQSFLSKSI